ncbi:hypothetical protein F4806DRAFT_506215 [Annulohypoxylon nitens]|nr:hypothetical protein F4806DRAFT_506215 [Annulohypoxylon nitens]
MGRTEPSVGKPPAGFRRDARAKRAKATANKVVPMVLAAHPRARRGVEASELIIDPPRIVPTATSQKRAGGGRKNSRRGREENGDGKGDGETVRGVGGIENGNRNRNGNINEKKNGPHISLRTADTLSTAYSLLFTPAPPSSETQEPGEQRPDLSNATARVGVLNMASPLAPGGGFLNGAAGQEEASLCSRTTLLPSLRDEFYRLPELGGVFTPDVLVFRKVDTATASRGKRKARHQEEAEEGKEGGADDEDEVLPKRERWFVDVVTAAMLRLPEIEVDEGTGWASYASAQDRELAVRKMRAVMRVFAAKGMKRVVLGAWGCGAYGNPVGEIARAWRKVLLCEGKGRKGAKEKAGEAWEGIERVVFAIRDAGMARAFATAFGEDVLEVCDEDEEEDLTDEENDAEDEKVKELRDKIQELELQVQQARTPQLRSGLNAVLVGLKAQLPDDEDIQSHQDAANHKNSGENGDGVSGSEDEDQSAGDESE